MRKLALLMSLGAILFTSCAATLRVRGTAPTQWNDGSCTAPILVPGVPGVMVHVRVPARGLEDSVSVLPGSPFVLTWQVPAGAYQVQCWASLSADPQFVGCDTLATFQAKAPPHRPSIFP